MAEIFQIDSKIVTETYNNKLNYEIFYNPKNANKSVAIYFSSNGIYFPNEEKEFREKILNQNRYEWKKNKISSCHKHIFIRDINKQWYLNGINKNINDVEKITEFLKKEIEGYNYIITVGVSSGGFASMLFGMKLNANKIFSFNGQFDLEYILKTSDCESKNPILFRNKNNHEYKKYYNLEKYIKNFIGDIFYFSSLNSDRDKQQIMIAKKYNNIIKILFNDNAHSLPFYPFLIRYILNLSGTEIKKLEIKKWNKISFSIKIIGPAKTIIYLLKYYTKNYTFKLLHK